ncbi:hypothetical protein B5E60_06605 [Alistipes sp. An116]|uniref:hypothetical protein n=1 Tax=unclassified Alistipes TaxID=2608932 RepID=UPI000B36B216|nr:MULTISPECIES: hypothetical protein [unclassified Alistipes]OUN77731.1 hypothetical protein B5G09_05405 [Alistipes sp. An54]OUQ53568.1 hypothetical protein B5E60_06605 [Alistipes sp. An116]
MSQNQTNVVITRSPKSQGIGIILTLLFGSLGLFYASIIGAIIMIVVEIAVAIFTLGLGLIVTHLICAVWSLIAVSSYNKKLLAGKN